VGVIEELEAEQPGYFTWSVVDVSTREGIKRLQELRPSTGRQIPVPGVVVDGEITFDRIPDMDEFTEWLQGRTGMA
jgi:hypothetical protein